MILLVTYDLKTSGHNYTPFYEALKTQGTSWWHYLSSTWLIDTNKTPKQLYDAVVPHITTNDNLLIIEVTGQYWGYLPKDSWEWVQRRLV
jgi:hypothetical protein